MPSEQPVDARLDREDHLVLDWSDGASLHYPVAHLRAHCPCAHCGPEEGQSPGDLIDRYAGIGLTGVDQVGNYALRLSFSDGHTLGIYTYDQLRKLGFTAEQSPRPFEV